MHFAVLSKTLIQLRNWTLILNLMDSEKELLTWRMKMHHCTKTSNFLIRSRKCPWIWWLQDQYVIGSKKMLIERKNNLFDICNIRHFFCYISCLVQKSHFHLWVNLLHVSIVIFCSEDHVLIIINESCFIS